MQFFTDANNFLTQYNIYITAYPSDKTALDQILSALSLNLSDGTINVQDLNAFGDATKGILYKQDGSLRDPQETIAVYASAGKLHTALDTQPERDAFLTVYGVTVNIADPAYLNKLFDITGGPKYTTPDAFTTALSKVAPLKAAIDTPAEKDAFLAVFGVAVDSADYLEKLFDITGGPKYTTPDAFTTALLKVAPLKAAIDTPAEKDAFLAVFGVAVDSADYLEKLFDITGGPKYTTPDAFTAALLNVAPLKTAIDTTEEKAAFLAVFGVAVDSADYLEKLLDIVGGAKYTTPDAFTTELLKAAPLKTAIDTA